MKCCICHFPITENEAWDYLNRPNGEPPLPPRHPASKCWDLAHDRIKYLEGALRIIADGTICPDPFPDETDENVIAAKTAMVTAIAALEHSESETFSEHDK